MKPAVLKRFPAARFIRVPGAREPRIRHSQHEGDVRLKWDDAYWADYQNAKDIGGFEVPWAPYGYHSYMEQEDVSRKQAEKLGLLKKGEQVPTADNKGLNDNLKASSKTLDPSIKKNLLDQLRREKELGKGRKSAAEMAREAGRKARLSAIERSLQKAKERGDTTEVDRIRQVLERERKEQGLDAAPKFHIENTRDEIRLTSEPSQQQSLESVDELKKKLLDAEEGYKAKYQKTIDEISRQDKELSDLLKLEPKKVTLSRVGAVAYNEWVQKYNDWANRYNRLSDKLRENKMSMHNAGLDLIALPEELQGSVNIIGKRPQRGQKAQGLNLFEQVVHKDLTERTFIEFMGGASRSSHADMGSYGKVWMNSKRPPSVVAHEIMHQTERRFLLEESQKFLAQRAGSELPKTMRKLTGMNSYKPDEVAYEDAFYERGSSHYAGRFYGRNAEEAKATELVTMGLERLLSNPIDFLKRDEEYFTWIVRLIQKRS